MKIITKMTLLAALVSSFSAFAAVNIDRKVCVTEKNDSTKGCLAYKLNIPDYPYPWLTKFVLNSTFYSDDLTVEDLSKINDLVKEYIAENVAPDAADDSEENDWSQAEEAGNFVQIGDEQILYSTGAAHSMASLSYFVFDKNSPDKPITTADLFVDGTEDKVQNVLQESYIQWLLDHPDISSISNRDDATKNIIAQFAENGKIPVSDSWYFAKGVIAFTYSPYEIGPYSFGIIEIPVPIAKLQGLVKEKYLQAAQDWKVPFNPKFDANS